MLSCCHPRRSSAVAPCVSSCVQGTQCLWRDCIERHGIVCPFDYQSSRQSLCKAESAVMMGRRQANAAPEVYQALEVACKALRVSRCLVPVEPVQRGVMTVRVVVSSLQQCRDRGLSEARLLHSKHRCSCPCERHIRDHASSLPEAQLRAHTKEKERLLAASRIPSNGRTRLP